MAYIGRSTDKLSNIEKLDVITFDGSSSYTLQKNSVNFTPSSANSLQVSIDGVVQAGNFTVSGSTIDFGVAIPSTSTNDFIFHYGTGLITTPADGTVTTGKIQDGAVTSAKLDSGISLGITMADQWRLTANTNTGTSADVTANWERADDAGWGGIGTGLTESSGIFSFPQTGIYLINYAAQMNVSASDATCSFVIKTTTNNSTYTTVGLSMAGNSYSSDAGGGSANFIFFDVTDITNYKFKFATTSFISNTYLRGVTNEQRTGFTVIRIGDT